MSNRKNRGDGSIRKRSDGRWEGRYTAGRNEETGKLIYKSVLARTQAECKRQLREAVWNREHKATPLTGLAQETQGTSAPQMNCQEYTVAQGSRPGTISMRNKIFEKAPKYNTATL